MPPWIVAFTLAAADTAERAVDEVAGARREGLRGDVRHGDGNAVVAGGAAGTGDERGAGEAGGVDDHIGALPQREEPAFPMSVREAITLGRWSHLGPFASPRADDDAAIASAIHRCDVGALVDYVGARIEAVHGQGWEPASVTARSLRGEDAGRLTEAGLRDPVAAAHPCQTSPCP